MEMLMLQRPSPSPSAMLSSSAFQHVRLPSSLSFHRGFSSVSSSPSFSFSSSSSSSLSSSSVHRRRLALWQLSSLRCVPKASETSIAQPIATEDEDEDGPLNALRAKEGLLKKRAMEVSDDLRGTCIYLIGMMGSGKSTVGKILSEALGYYFFDSDNLIEEEAGGISVREIFKEKSEEGFRDIETKVLKKISSLNRLVVATGGGIVVRQINWSYLGHGITVYLDVPLETLAKRIASVGVHSRPLLGQDSGESAFNQALDRLSKIYEARGMSYKSADATVSLQEIAAVLDCEDVSLLTPTVIAVEVLEEIKRLLRDKKRRNSAAGA